MKVLIAIDQTRAAGQVVESVLRRKWNTDTQFRVLTVVEPATTHLNDFADTEIREAAHELDVRINKRANRLLREARSLLMYKLPDCQVQTELRIGEAQTEILTTAVEWLPDKIIMGASRGVANERHPGSVASAVAGHATSAVELVQVLACDGLISTIHHGCDDNLPGLTH